MKKDHNTIIRFSPMEKAQSNPYIGFTSYQRFRGEPLYSDIVVRPENHGTETERVECYPVSPDEEQNGDLQGFYPDTQVAYIRLLWKEFEPQRKQYQYALIEDVLRRAKEKGQTVMLRLMPHSTRARDDVPDWLKELIPCPERPEGMRVKDSPRDPVYLRYFGEAIEALAKRFDSDPTLDVMDISLTGSWGEGHKVSQYPKSALKQLVDVYTRNFHNTHLIGQTAAPRLVSYACKSKPCGWRGDGVGEPKHMNVIYPKAAKAMPRNAWKHAPVSFESYWWLGEWDRQGWDLNKIIEKTLSWHISTFNAKSLPIPEKYREQIERWESKMGYHFVLCEASYPSKAKGGERLRFSLKVNNRGVAPIYTRIPLRVRLRGEGEEYLFTTKVDSGKWLPGEHKVAFQITLPARMKAGRYEAAITLSGENTPVVRWETQGDWDGAFFSIGRIEVLEKKPLSNMARAEKRKAYLLDFLCEFGYPAEAKNALEKAFDLVFSEKRNLRAFEKIRSRFEKKPDEKLSFLVAAADKIAATSALHPCTVYLLLLILLSESSKTVYAKRNVPLEMWRSNMLDLKYVSDNCVLLKGVYGSYCPLWAGRFFAATRFTFGKLQFETDRLGKEYNKGGVHLRPEDKVIYIHIPRSGERLMPEDVDASCEAASAFFQQRYGLKQVVFACHSWLLYPENKQMLSPTSNLYSFIDRFDIINVQEDTEYKEIWRLFDKEYDGDADSLPQDTSLRRAYAQRVKEKKPLGLGLGVWVYKQ